MGTIVRTLNGWVVSICQLLALFVILTGVLKALTIYARNILSTSLSALSFQKSRLEMGYAMRKAAPFCF